MKLLLSLVVVVAATGTELGRAEADCGTPHWIGTPSGSTLPVRGSLYLHDEGLKYGRSPKPSMTWTGTGSEWVAEPLSETVVRVDYDATRASALRLAIDDYDSFQYAFDARWRAPAAAPRVLQYWHHESEWTCSSSDSVMIQLDQPAAAFEVSWTFNGVTRTFIEPARTDGDQAALELGKIDCGSTSIEPDELAWGGELSLTAIRFDRSRVAVAGMPMHVKLREMPTSEDGLGHAFIIPPVVHAAPPVAPRPDGSPQVAVIALLLISLGVLVALRFRVRAPTSI